MKTEQTAQDLSVIPDVNNRAKEIALRKLNQVQQEWSDPGSHMFLRFNAERNSDFSRDTLRCRAALEAMHALSLGAWAPLDEEERKLIDVQLRAFLRDSEDPYVERNKSYSSERFWTFLDVGCISEREPTQMLFTRDLTLAESRKNDNWVASVSSRPSVLNTQTDTMYFSELAEHFAEYAGRVDEIIKWAGPTLKVDSHEHLEALKTLALYGERVAQQGKLEYVVEPAGPAKDSPRVSPQALPSRG